MRVCEREYSVILELQMIGLTGDYEISREYVCVSVCLCVSIVLLRGIKHKCTLEVREAARMTAVQIYCTV